MTRWKVICAALCAAIFVLAPLASSQATLYGAGCVGLNPEPVIGHSGSLSPDQFSTVSLTGAPPGGQVIAIIGFNNEMFGPDPIPFDVSHVPGVNPGCAVWSSADFPLLFINADLSGEVHMSFPVPTNVGEDLYFQWGVIEQAGPNSVTLTQGLHLHFTAVPEADSSSLAFSPEVVGQISAPQVVTLTNETDRPLTIDDVIVNGDRTGDFVAVLAQTAPVLLLPEDTVDVQVTFQPNSPGLHTANLQVVQNALPAGWTPTEVALSGIAQGALTNEYLLNCGGSTYVDSQGRTFTPDFAYTGGLPDDSGAVVTGTSDPDLYPSARKADAFGYDLPAPNGDYEVTLRFAETRLDQTGLRVQDVTIEGVLVLDDYDTHAAVGFEVADDWTFPVTLTDGSFDIDFTKVGAANAQVSAIEVRAMVPVLDIDLPSLDFGTLSQGGMLTLPLQVSNAGLDDLTLASLDFLIGVGGGEGSEFIVDVDGSSYSGASVSVNVPIVPPLLLVPAASTQVDVTFSPTVHQSNDVVLQFNSNADPVQVQLTATGGSLGHPFLHVVIVTDDVIVDYDENGSENVLLIGSDSHTHEPFKALTDYEWREGPTVLSASVDPTLSFPVGPHTVCLEIWDDNIPQESLVECASFEIFDPNTIPGVLALYYFGGIGQSPGPLLDSIPANSDFGEIRTELKVIEEGGIGGSPFSESVMVRLQANVDIDTAGNYEFAALGGDDQRLEINGSPYVGPLALGVGLHTVEARFSILDLGNLPVEVTMGLQGGSLTPIATDDLTYDALQDAPVINSMPGAGITLGGDEVIITGFGFFPSNQVTVHWGGIDITEASFLRRTDEEIVFFSPPHAAGVIAVTVETPQGISNSLNYTYDEAATPPISFTMTSPVSAVSPTACEWGPDGRLYVPLRTGQLLAVTFDDDYNVLAETTYDGLINLSNKEILGITFNPYDPPSPVRVYVSHNELYAQGGGAFGGTAPYPGAVSILEGPAFDTPIPLITGLPVSNHDHAINGIQFDNNGDLLISSGANTNAGIPTVAHGTLPETPLNVAVLKAKTSKIGFNGTITYVETIGGAPNNDQVFGDIVDVAPGVDVEVFAPGVRNTYGLIFTTKGMLYGVDNGPNVSFGPGSVTCSTDTGSGAAAGDELNLIEYGVYYGGPNRNRGRYDPRQCVWYHANATSIPGVFRGKLQSMSSSTNGILEYRSTAFAGQILGHLMVEKWNNPVKRVKLADDGRSVLSVNTITPNLSALDICLGPGGVVIGADYTSNVISILKPNDVSVGTSMVAWDIFPWRAPASGGNTFTIGGHNFGNIGNTSVTIGGIPATLTSVTSKRIDGIIPANGSPTTDLLDVVVVSDAQQSNLPDTFRYLFVPQGSEPGRWETKADMPTKVGEIAAAIIDGVLYVVGESSNKTQGYDIHADSWDDTLAVRSFAGHHHAAEAYDGKLYVIGGLTNGAPGKVQIYDPVLDSWSLGTPMPWNGGSVNTALIDGKIYAAGGIVGSTTVDNCAVYDPVLDSWTALAPVPSGLGRNHAAAGTDGVKLYIFGGRGIGSGASNVVANGFDSVQIYDPLLDSWITSDDVVPPGSDLEPLPQFRGGMGKAVWLQDEFYIFGGETLDGPGATPQDVYDRVDVYDPATDTWRLEAEMPTPRHGIYPLLFEGRVFVVAGGKSAGFAKDDTVEIFSRP